MMRLDELMLVEHNNGKLSFKWNWALFNTFDISMQSSLLMDYYDYLIDLRLLTGNTSIITNFKPFIMLVVRSPNTKSIISFVNNDKIDADPYLIGTIEEYSTSIK